MSRCSTARDAQASELAEPVVLLSPACASFDQYRNFEIRGAAFRDLVTALPGVRPVVVACPPGRGAAFLHAAPQSPGSLSPCT